MHLKIEDPNVHFLIDLLERVGHESRLVGGAVRDMVSGVFPKDMDLATTALPELVVQESQERGLNVIETGLQHGTVTVVVDHIPYEITTLRRDVSTDGRHAEVEFITRQNNDGSDPFREDAQRRDFTFNAMSLSADGTLHDYFGGLSDLQDKRVRFVGDARERIREDYLRILRFFRFRARYGGNETPNDINAICDDRHGLSSISVERVWREMSKILIHPNGTSQLALMEDLGINEVIGLPKLPSSVPDLKKAVCDGASAGSCLGFVCGRPDAAISVAKAWKLSCSELNDASLVSSVLAHPSASPNYWLMKAVDGMNAKQASIALALTGRLAASEALKGDIPVFPLRGADILHMCAPGPDVGNLLKAAKEAWYESGFSLGRDDLVSMLEENHLAPSSGGVPGCP